MWTSFKEILATVETAILHKRSEVYAELDEVLTNYKPSFISLLKNPGKNASHREQVQKSNKLELELEGHALGIKLQEATIQDVLLISNALNLNEFSCVELILTAEQQLPNFPGFSTPLIASLLYHDGRRCLLSALKLLLTARPGVTWTLELDDRIIELIEKFVDQLIEDGLVSKCLQLLENLSLPNELTKLKKARCLIDGKHKKLITELIQEQQQLLSDCLFSLSSQFPFQKDDCVKLINHLKLVAPNTADGSLDFVIIRVLLALLASFNCSIVDTVVENLEDDQYQRLPYFNDKSFITTIHQAVVRPDVQLWQTPGIKYLIQFCWSIFLRTCSAHPELVDFYGDVIEEDEGILDAAIDGGALKFLQNSIIGSSNFHKEEYFVKIIHSYITSFIVKFPLKMKDLRNRGDENARILQAHLEEGMDPPKGLRHDFQDFMQLVSALYSKDPLELELNSEYWIPPEPLGGVFSPRPLQKYQQATEQRKLMLNKFVRLAGDILVQPLYVPYINMLASLANNEQAASYCFRLLSSNGSMESHGACSVSWDHFFMSIKQYYSNLRHVTDAADHRSHMHRHHEISPEEISGLESVLRLIKAVADKNESVRIAFCENQTWLPVASLLGLVCCPVPPGMKGLLLETLAAFAKTPEIAASLWHSVEASQVLQTTNIPSGTGSATKTGIVVELQEIETRNETYPETRGFIQLLDCLTEIPIPNTLGAGHRVPGFDPYLDFLTKHVFLKFKTRAYQDATEKWKLGSEVCKILVKLLKDYEPSIEHFDSHQVEIQGVNFGKAAKQPGFQLMIAYLNDTPMLRTTLSVIDDVLQELLITLTTSEMKDILEEAAEHCLQLLSLVFEKQMIFMENARSSRTQVLLSPLDELLLSVNPRTGCPDYLGMLGRYMTVNNLKPTLTLNVVKIFKHTCNGSKAQKEIVEMLTQDEVLSRQILVGFSDQLEMVDPEEEFKNDINNLHNGGTLGENTCDLIRQNIVNLLISTLHQKSPNMAQFMLGFEVRRPVSKTHLQGAGVGGFPKTCLHSVIDVLNRRLEDISTSTCLTPKLSELLYRLIYMLCAQMEMGPIIRRYLRGKDFFLKHCQLLPFVQSKPEVDFNELLYIRLANQQSWLLKAIAIEFRVVAVNRMRSGLQQLLSLLYADQAVGNGIAPPIVHENSTVFHNSTISTRKTLSQSMFNSNFTLGCDNRSLILVLLNSLSFTQRYPPRVQLNFFDYNAIEQLIVSCEEADEMGIMLCNVQRLFRTLMSEINNSQSAVSTSQKEEILAEVKCVMKHAVDRNLVRQSFHAKNNAFDAWRQLVEVTFAVCPVDMISVDNKQSILTEVLQGIIAMMVSGENLQELTSSIGGTILSLMANLWFTFTQTDALLVTPDNSGISLSTVNSMLAGLVEGIIASDGGQPRMRANLYGAFLYYTQIGQMCSSVTSSEGVSGSNIFGNQTREKWEMHTLEVLDKFGEKFVDIVAKDMHQGPCISRMMAMSVLDAVTSLDWKHKYLMMMSSSGHLRVLIGQLLDDDTELLTVLSVQPQSMKPLYLFESKMAFLAKISSTEFGAQTLLQLGLISRLSECQFLDFHVDKPTMLANATLNYTQSHDPFLPSLVQRYSTIFSAFAKLILSILSSLGIHHQVAISQVQNLIMCHQDAIQNILQDGSKLHSINSLKQLSLTIAIISMLPITDSHDDAWEILTDDQRHWRTFMNRVQRQMGTLLKKYSSCTLEKQMNEILKFEHLHDVTIRSSPLNINALETQNTLLQIRTRILTFYKNVVSTQGLSGPYSRVVFAPMFTENSIHETKLLTGKQIPTKQLPSLSVLVQELNDCPEQLKHCLENSKILQRKLDTINEMTHEEIKEILSQEEDCERLPYHQRQIVVKRIIQKLLTLREAEADSLSYIIEHVIYLLWRHLDYYYVHCIPEEDTYLEDGNLTRSFHSDRTRRLTDRSFTSFANQTIINSPSNFDRSNVHQLDKGITKEEVRELKVEAVAVLNDTLWKKVLETDQLHGRQRSRLSFSSALVRRLQGLVQLNS